MNKYIGFKLIQAEEMTLKEFNEKYNKVIPATQGEEGYKVVYPDGYTSWSPKEVFEKAYMQISDKNTIIQQNVIGFIKDIDVSTIGEKTTLVRATLVNGFEIIEASSCVDPANYDEEMGATICIEKIHDKIWAYLGFLLQTAVGGIK